MSKFKSRVDIRVTGHMEELKEFVRICKVIQKLGEEGSNRTFKIGVDGDGSGHLKFQGISNEILTDFNTDGIDTEKLNEMDLSIGE